MVHGYGILEVKNNDEVIFDPLFGIENTKSDSLFLYRKVEVFIEEKDEKDEEK